MIIAELATSVATMLDGIIIAHFFDKYAVASYGLTSPYTNMLKMIGCFFATGTQVVYSRFAASGNYRRANEIFTTSAIILAIVSCVIAATIYGFSGKIALMLGASADPGNLQQHTSDYLRGLALGLPLNLGVAFLMPLMNIDGDKKRIALAINTMLTANLLGDLVVILYFNGSMFGLALATSVSYLCSIVVLLIHFTKKQSSIRLCRIRGGGYTEVVRAGLIPAITRSFSMFRSYAVNILFITLAGAGALAANTLVQSNIKAVPMCIATAIGSTTLSISGVLYEEHDSRGLQQILDSVLLISFGPCLIITIVIFIFAPQILTIFGASDMVDLTVLALRCYILGLPIIGVKMFFIYYFQSAEKRLLSYYSSFAGEFLFLVVSMAVLGKALGNIGLFISYPVAELLYIISLIMIAWISSGSFPHDIRDMLFLPGDFDADEGKTIDVSINDISEVSGLSDKAMKFCKSNGVDARKSFFIALVVEEMAGNIFEHGADDGRHHYVDMKIILLPESIKLRLRDNCRPFNPKERAELLTDDPEHNIGIRIVSGISKSMNYANLFNINQLIIEI